MTDYNFIKRCKNYNIKNSEGFKYETIINISLNKIKKLDEEINNIYHCLDNWSYEKNEITNEYMNNRNINTYNKYRGKKNKLLSKFIFFYKLRGEYYENLLIEKEQEKIKMCIHKLKLYLPDHLIYEIGTYF